MGRPQFSSPEHTTETGTETLETSVHFPSPSIDWMGGQMELVGIDPILPELFEPVTIHLSILYLRVNSSEDF